MSNPACKHCRNGYFDGTDIECVNGVLIDIDVAHEGWQRDVNYPAAPCVSKSGLWPKRDRGCQVRLNEWADRGSPELTEEPNNTKEQSLTKMPSVSSLGGWNVGITDYGTLEVRITLTDKQEARAWALWLLEQQEAVR